jgi:polar amino acid transport system substrate-binding protein
LKLDLNEFNSTQEALRSTQSGQVAAAIVDPISFYDFERAGNSSLKMVGKTLADELYIIAVRKDSPTLLQQVNALIDVMQREGSLEELRKKWF